ncbi:MAG: AAA family ATPase [Candidatus Omnitrophota bacterium]
MKKIFIAATKQNDGKTTVALGLIFNLMNKFKNVGFIKPIGQRYLEEEGLKVDEDSVLVEKTLEVCGIKCGIKDMSPIAVEKGFTERYINEPNKAALTEQIQTSFNHVAKGNEIVIIEGTGHAGVGSVFDHSNASVAKLLGSKVVLISSGGIGRPIDEIVLNKSLFDKEGVELAGVIINKVLPNKFKKIDKLVRAGLKRKGIEVLGVMPYNPMLSCPSIEQILDETDYELLTGKGAVNNRAERILVGAMEPHNAINYIQDNSLIITPGDRGDIILTVLSLHLMKKAGSRRIAGIVISGGIIPHEPIMDLVRESGIPMLLAKKDTYTVASQIHDLTVKIRPQDKEKIDMVIKMVKEYVDIDKIYQRI